MGRFSLEKIVNAVAGPSDDYSLEHRVFNCAIAICMSSSIPGFFYMLFIGSLPITLFLVFSNISYFTIYYLSRFSNKLQKALLGFGLLQCISLNVFWIVDYGVQGTTGFLIYVILIIIVFTAEKPNGYVAVLFTNLVLLSIFDTKIQEMVQFEIPYNIVTEKIALICAIFYTTVLVILYKKLIRRRLDQTYYDVMGQLDSESEIVSQNATTLANTSEDLLNFALQQKSATEQLSVTTEELGATAEQNQHLASKAMITIKDADNHVTQSRETIGVLVNSIDKINQSGKEIKTINDVINDIAFQTNILSLNAMIEASRSSEHNGGFKVVAMEVKRLAERSKQAAESINTLLNNNFQTVQESVNLAEDMNQRFNEISQAIQPLVGMIQNVSDASAEQHEAIRQITKGISEIDRAVDENKNLAALSSTTANELHNNATSLLNVVEMLQNLIEDA